MQKYGIGMSTLPRGMHPFESRLYQRRHVIWELGQTESEIYWFIWSTQTSRQGSLSTSTTTDLSAVHRMFHVSMLKNYVPDGSHKLQYEELDVRPDLYYEEATWILDRSMKTLCRKEVPLVKVLWSWQGVEEVTWDHEDEMRRPFPRLFPVDDDNSRY